MKKIALVLMAIAIVSSAAFAGDMAKSGQWGVQTSLSTSSSTLGLKFMASENLAIRVEGGFASVTPSVPTGETSSSTTAYQFGAGFEYHMTAVGSVSPYVGLGGGYLGKSLPDLPSGYSNPNAWFIEGHWGGEYFFSSNFSWAGQIGLEYASANTNNFSLPVPSGYSNANSFSTFNATMIATWYLN
jgi:hypothetical protein